MDEIEKLRRALSIDPDNRMIRLRLAHLLQRLGHNEDPLSKHELIFKPAVRTPAKRMSGIKLEILKSIWKESNLEDLNKFIDYNWEQLIDLGIDFSKGILGCGGSGCVFKTFEGLVAKITLDSKEIDFLTEVSRIGPDVIPYIEDIYKIDEFYIILREELYLLEGELAEDFVLLARDYRGMKFNEFLNQIHREEFTSLVENLHNLHNKNIVVMDFKFHNVGLTENGNIVIFDGWLKNI
jgi:hypothetical protein